MKLVCVSIGRPQILLHEGRPFSSAINRRPVDGPVRLSAEGLPGDHVSDSANHGGPDKAVCCYPVEHYDFWRDTLRSGLPVPSFGENFTTRGLLENEVCVGDRLSIGKSVVEVTQPRQPCSKLARKHNSPLLPRWVNERGYTGFYLRVVEPGEVCRGDPIALLNRPHPDVTVLWATRTLLDSARDVDALNRLAGVAELSGSWKRAVAQRLSPQADDDAEA